MEARRRFNMLGRLHHVMPWCNSMRMQWVSAHRTRRGNGSTHLGIVDGSNLNQRELLYLREQVSSQFSCCFSEYIGVLTSWLGWLKFTRTHPLSYRYLLSFASVVSIFLFPIADGEYSENMLHCNTCLSDLHLHWSSRTVPAEQQFEK